MKWYSVKDYKIPAHLGYLFVALKVEEMCTYTIAEYTYNIKTDKFDWFNESGDTLSQVTHFCIPDPVEIEA
jgi:hypothetical protein